MARTLSILVFIVVVIQLIKPLGVLGLNRRADAWKLVFVGILVVAVVAIVRPD